MIIAEAMGEPRNSYTFDPAVIVPMNSLTKGTAAVYTLRGTDLRSPVRDGWSERSWSSP